MPLAPQADCPLWVTCGRRLGKNFLTLLPLFARLPPDEAWNRQSLIATISEPGFSVRCNIPGNNLQISLRHPANAALSVVNLKSGLERQRWRDAMV